MAGLGLPEPVQRGNMPIGNGIGFDTPAGETGVAKRGLAPPKGVGPSDGYGGLSGGQRAHDNITKGLGDRRGVPGGPPAP